LHALLFVALGCVVTFRDVPRVGVNEWHEYLGDPSRAPAADEDLGSTPTIAWLAEVGRGVTGAAAVGERVTVVASAERWVHALDTRSGELFWRYRGPGAYGAGPVIGGGQVFVATEGGDGFVTAIDVFTGRRRWQRRLGPVASPLVLRDTTLYVVTQSGLLFALDSRTGTARWSRLAAPSRAGALVTGAFVAVAGLNDSLLVFARDGGQVLARTRLPVSVIAPLAAWGDSLAIAASPAGSLAAVHLPAGDVRWQVTTGDPVAGSPAVAGDTAYALTTACALWRIPVSGPPHPEPAPLGCRTATGPMLVRGGLLVATIRGELQLHDRAGRTRRWSIELGGEIRHPAIIQHGQIVVVPVLGDVVSLR
jgi:glucose dehydrogenase